MAERLRDVADQLPGCRIRHLRQQAHVIAKVGQGLELAPGAVTVAEQVQALRQPVAADDEAVGVVGPAMDVRPLGELALDRLDRGAHPWLACVDEPNHRQKQHGCVELLRVIRASERVGL